MITKIPLNLAKKFLRESYKINDSDNLSNLIEYLESKDDPDPDELYILEAIYQYVEKLNLLESHLNKYVQKSKNIKNKLVDLYENDNSYGSSKFFK